MVYPGEYARLTHKNCAKYRNGYCTLSGISVDPNGYACPRFVPRLKTKTLSSEIVRSHPETKQYARTLVSNRKVRDQDKEALIQRFMELEKQLKDVKLRLKKLR